MKFKKKGLYTRKKQTARERIDDVLCFIRQITLKPLRIGALAPSSESLAEAMCSEVENLSDKAVVLELGVGTGALTEVILDRMVNRANYTGFEINPELVERLKLKFPQEKFIQDSVVHLDRYFPGTGVLDAVISSLPWSLIDKDTENKMLDMIQQKLASNGSFTTLVYVPSLVLNHKFIQKLKERFKTVQITDLILMNLPPSLVVRSWK